MKIFTCLTFLVFSCLALFANPLIAFGEDFYAGKTVRFVVGFSPGGGYDIYTRTIARHIGKHLPGKPTTVVENMPGAGSLISANYLYHGAKPDGLTIGNFIGPLVLQQVLGNKAATFDGRKFGWIWRTGFRSRSLHLQQHGRHPDDETMAIGEQNTENRRGSAGLQHLGRPTHPERGSQRAAAGGRRLQGYR